MKEKNRGGGSERGDEGLQKKRKEDNRTEGMLMFNGSGGQRRRETRIGRRRVEDNKKKE